MTPKETKGCLFGVFAPDFQIVSLQPVHELQLDQNGTQNPKGVNMAQTVPFWDPCMELTQCGAWDSPGISWDPAWVTLGTLHGIHRDPTWGPTGTPYGVRLGHCVGSS